MRRRLLTIALLVSMTLTATAGTEGATARFGAFLKAVGHARTLHDLRPFLSARAWKPLENGARSAPKEQATMVKILGNIYKGCKVTGSYVSGAKVVIKTSTPAPDGKTLLGKSVMIKEGGAWVLDE